MKRFISIFAVLVFLVATCKKQDITTFQSQWQQNHDRYWAGPEFWANRLQDWQIKEGKLQCINTDQPLRTMHLLTHSMPGNESKLKMDVQIGLVDPNDELKENTYGGFLIGAGDLAMDYRARALVHSAYGKNGGIIAAISPDGKIAFLDNTRQRKKLKTYNETPPKIKAISKNGLELILNLVPKDTSYQLTLKAYSIPGGKLISSASTTIPRNLVSGNMALISHGGSSQSNKGFWFENWKISGAKLNVNDEYALGPVMAVQYTLNRNTLKLTAQMAPVSEKNLEGILEIAPKGSNKWEEVARSKIITPGYTLPFRVDNWDSKKDYQYRVKYVVPLQKGKTKTYYYHGSIKRDPVDKETISVAAFTGNNNSHGSIHEKFEFSNNTIWFPHAGLVKHVLLHKPDLLVFTGDQVYEGRPTFPDRSGGKLSQLDYLYKWYLWCWAHGKMTKDIPTVSIPDDHDVYHGNIWGAGGKKAEPLPEGETYPEYYKGFENHYQQDRGGYVMEPAFVNMVERTQTSHLPDPYDPEPVKQGIGVYYTDMLYGGISFAILEDRKFKSSPSVQLPHAKVVNGFSQIEDIPAFAMDDPEAKLLGTRQLKFLEEWAGNWEGTRMKSTISQSIFACISTYPDSFLTDAGTPKLHPLPQDSIPADYEKAKDMDSNGWPQSGRDRALKSIRKGFAFMIGGDQHLGSIVHHGVDEWNDAGYSFCVPSIANLWPRRWFPPGPGNNHLDGMPGYTGEYLDGFHNKVTVWAVSNPYQSNHEPASLHDRAPGYGIVRFDKKKQKITMECWPRYSNPKENGKQYPGWPKTISMESNYGRKAFDFLPLIKTKGLEQPPVMLLIKESDSSLVYARRMKSQNFRAKIFEPGSYTLVIGEPGTHRMDTLKGIRPSLEEVTLTFEQ